MSRVPFSLKNSGVVILFILLGLYALFQARFIILGPSIYIDSHKDGSLVTENVIILSGRAKNIAYISLNDRPIFIDSKGNWNEKYVVPSGLSVITLRAKDRFGRETEKKLSLVYNGI